MPRYECAAEEQVAQGLTTSIVENTASVNHLGNPGSGRSYMLDARRLTHLSSSLDSRQLRGGCGGYFYFVRTGR
jgi:hypothetical protein